MRLGEFGVVHHVADEREGEQRFDPAGRAGDDRDGARGGDGSDGRVAQPPTLGLPGAADEVREDAALAGQLLRSPLGFFVDEAHDLMRQGDAFGRVVRDAQLDQQVGPAHDAQPDLAVALGHLLDLGQGVAVHIDDVVEEVHGRPRDPPQLVPIDLAVLQHEGQVDGTEVATLVRKERLFTAGIGRLDRPDVRRRIVAVEAVEEDDAGLAVLPRQLDDQVEHLAGVVPGHLDPVARVTHRVVASLAHRAHEVLGQPHRDVEVVEDVLLFLGGDELQDVGVVDPQDAHVGAPPRPALLDRLGGRVEHLHERDRAAGHAHGRAHQVVPGSQPAEAEPGTATRLMHQRRILQRAEDRIHGVLDRQDEAGRELLQLAPGVHEGRGVGQELEAGHQLEELLDHGVDVGRRVVGQLGLGDVLGHPGEHVGGRLEGQALLVAYQVALLEDLQSARRKGAVELRGQLSYLAERHRMLSFVRRANSSLNSSMLSNCR